MSQIFIRFEGQTYHVESQRKSDTFIDVDAIFSENKKLKEKLQSIANTVEEILKGVRP